MLVIHLVIWVKSQKKSLQDKTLLEVYNQQLNYLNIKKTDRSFLVAGWLGARVELQRSSDGGEHNQGENSVHQKAVHTWQRLVTQWDIKPPDTDDRVTHARQ